MFNKWTIAGGTILFLLFAWTAATIAQSTPPAEIDSGVEAFADALGDQQAQYFAEHGRYAQILPSSGGTAQEAQALQLQPARALQTTQDEQTSPLPTPTAPPVEVQCPEDQPDCPPVGLVEGVIVAVNVYEAPSGPGYEVVSEYTDAYGQTWRQVQNYGPEIWRNKAWHVVNEELP